MKIRNEPIKDVLRMVDIWKIGEYSFGQFEQCGAEE